MVSVSYLISAFGRLPDVKTFPYDIYVYPYTDEEGKLKKITFVKGLNEWNVKGFSDV